MLEKTDKIKERYDQLTQLIMKSEIIADNKQWKTLVKERNSYEDIVNKREELIAVLESLKGCEKSLNEEQDPELEQMFKDEIYELKGKKIELEDELQILLLPKDEDDDKNVIIEIRPAAGGDESTLFNSVLFKMYTRYAERHNWKVEINDIVETELGGIKECSFTIKGKNAYSRLKFESGVHRVQRVPETESQGRIHTSTSTIAVLPEIEDIEMEILDKDLRIDTYRSSGAGGQHVNKTDSAVRMTHLPTGLVVACQDERSQIQNREKAMNLLKNKLYSYYKEIADKKYKENRKSQVGTGDRSERIRTYNYPQGRITDHRINFSVFNIDYFLDGDMDEMIDELLRADQQAKLDSLN